MLKRIGQANIVDTWDDGRLLNNRSHYGGENVGKWGQQDWPFNPVQGGNHDSKAVPQVVSSRLVHERKHVCSVIPVDWSTGELQPDIRIDQSYEIASSVITYKSRVRVLSGRTWPEWDQEVSAIFLRRSYSTLVTSAGFVQLPRQDVPGFRSVYGPLNGWFGVVNRNGHGLWATTAAPRWTGYCTGASVQSAASCAYVSPIVRGVIAPGADWPIESRMYIGTRQFAARHLGIPAT
jgi:hypothetical protein